MDVYILKNREEVIHNGERLDIQNLLKDIDIEKKVSEFILNLENSIADGVNICNIYKYDKLEMYNFSRGTFCSELRSILQKFFLIKRVIEVFPKEQITVFSDDSIVKDISEEVFKINFVYKTEDYLNRVKKNKIKDLILKSTRIIRGALYLVKMYFNRKEKTLLITQAADINNIVINNESIYYDSQIGYLLDELKKKTTLLKLQLLNEGVDTKRANMLGKDFVPYEVIIILKKIITKFKIDSNKIEDNIDKLHLLNWKVDGYDLSKIADKYLEDMLRNSIISNVKEEIYAEHFLNKINVTSVIATDEADRPRCFIVAGNKNKLNTYGIQHGIIAPVSRSYMIPSDDNIYVPKITFLWGEKYKNILIDNSKVYTENNLKVVGQLRTDYLIKKTNSEREKIKKDEKIRILYATQYLWDLTYEATNIFIDAIEKLENVEVLIKLHPVDKYEEFYEKLIKERKLKNVKISREIDIYEAILWSDLVVTVHSTVVLEAALLNKPSICILLNKYYDQGGFVKKGISIGVSSAEEFYTVLTEHRYENSNLSQYVEENFYKVDGNVFKRIEENINIK